MADEDASERTEAASAQRLVRARAQGNLPLSRDLASVVTLAAGTGILMLLGPVMAHGTALRLHAYWENLAAWDATGPLPWHNAALALLSGAGPIVLAVLLCACAIGLGQTGFALRPFAPDLSRISPLAGIKRLFSPDHLMDSGKAVVKLIVLGLGLRQLMVEHVATAAAALDWTAPALLEAIRHDIVELLIYLVVAQVAIAVLDMLWVRLRYAGRMRMSRLEVKEEHRESDGDPRIKARLRQIRMARRRRMLAAVPKATLVVTNPTHYAVALAYARGEAGAPRVIAKGTDEVARRIREVAQDHRIPVLPNPLLARTLFKVELDAEIPAENFRAVAELIAYVWRLQTRAKAIGL